MLMEGFSLASLISKVSKSLLTHLGYIEDLFCQILPEEWLIERTQQVGATVQSAFSFFFRHLLRNCRYFPRLALQFSDSWQSAPNAPGS